MAATPDETQRSLVQKLMIRYSKILLILLVVVLGVFAQTHDQSVKWQTAILNNDGLFKREYKASIAKYDFGSLWTRPDNSNVYGFIGDNYQRIRIKIISATRSKRSSDTYIIMGKSMVKGNICTFHGTIKITHARTYKKMHWGVDDKYKKTGIRMQGVLIAEYHFLEDDTQPHSGIFDGVLSTYWYVDKNGKINYDDLEKDSDSYGNNQFVGIWRGHRSEPVKICNWGDYRIPLSGDLDIGAGEFSPADRYLKYGWQSVRDAYSNDDGNARRQEVQNWWN
jgi:hypothetical protein